MIVTSHARFRFLAALASFCLAAMLFLVSIWATAAPHDFDRRVEWVQLKIAALLPHEPHPDYVPTPLVVVVIATPEPTATPENTPSPRASSTRPPARSTPTATRPPVPTRADSSSANLPPRVALTNFRHDYQRFNNCGPTTTSILLSHFGRSETQYDLAPLLKGNKDDRNVSPDEIAALVRSYGYNAIVRVNGDENEMKAFLSKGIPVMIENWFEPNVKDASGHYRLLIGYDDTGTASTRGMGLSVEFGDNYPATENGYFIAEDAYIGPNTKLPYQAWDLDWHVFNRTYLVAYTDAQANVVAAMLGSNADDATMYAKAREVAAREVAANPNDAYGWFNLGSSLVNLGKYAEAARDYDPARLLQLPWRMLWYQFGPYEAYYRAGRYDEVVALANATLAASPGLEESLYYRGLAQLALGQKDDARASFRLALQANPRFSRAQQALDGMGAQP